MSQEKVKTLDSSTLSFQQYQELSSETAIYPTTFQGMPDDMAGIFYTVLGLCGEAGEIANKVKKIWRDSGGLVTPEDLKMLAKETGDVQWYLSQFSKNLDIALGEIAKGNLEKLFSRKERGTLQGDGDSR